MKEIEIDHADATAVFDSEASLTQEEMEILEDLVFWLREAIPVATRGLLGFKLKSGVKVGIRLKQG